MENIQNRYTEEDFETLSWNEHIRRRSGMYIGKLGDGSSPDDGIYVLLKEIIDNSIDEFKMGAGKQIIIDIKEREVTVRDFGRGIPLGKLVDANGHWCKECFNRGITYRKLDHHKDRTARRWAELMYYKMH